MKIMINDIKKWSWVLIGVVFNANILTLISTLAWSIVMSVFNVAYPGWFNMQLLCLGVLALTFDPGQGDLNEQMNRRFFNSSLILVYMFALWALNLVQF